VVTKTNHECTEEEWQKKKAPKRGKTWGTPRDSTKRALPDITNCQKPSKNGEGKMKRTGAHPTHGCNAQTLLENGRGEKGRVVGQQQKKNQQSPLMTKTGGRTSQKNIRKPSTIKSNRGGGESSNKKKPQL